MAARRIAKPSPADLRAANVAILGHRDRFDAYLGTWRPIASICAATKWSPIGALVAALLVVLLFAQFYWVNAIAVALTVVYMGYWSWITIGTNDVKALKEALTYWVVYAVLWCCGFLQMYPSDSWLFVAIKFAVIAVILSTLGLKVVYFCLERVVGIHSEAVTNLIAHTRDTIESALVPPPPTPSPPPPPPPPPPQSNAPLPSPSSPRGSPRESRRRSRDRSSDKPRRHHVDLREP